MAGTEADRSATGLQTIGTVLSKIVPQRTPSGPSWQPGERPSSRPLSAPDERICPVCKGLRWVQIPDPHGPFVFWPERTRVDHCPVCARDAGQAYLQRLSGLSGDLLGVSFDSPEINRTCGNAEAWDHLRGLVMRPQWLTTLTGPYGVGKTTLLACLVNAGRAAKWTSVYTTTAAVLDHLRNAYAPSAPSLSFDGVWERLVDAKILAVDELDRWNPTPWAQEKFFELVDTRYQDGREKCTAFATNAQVDSLPPYIASRLRDRRCRVFELAGGDLRQA